MNTLLCCNNLWGLTRRLAYVPGPLEHTRCLMLASALQVRASSFPPAAVEDSAVAPVDAVSSEELSACQVYTRHLLLP